MWLGVWGGGEEGRGLVLRRSHTHTTRTTLTHNTKQYIGVSLWGDADDQPTAVILAAGSNTPVFTYTTPGSMFGVDIVVDKAASTATQDQVYFAVAGKAVPANQMGSGGDAFAWQVTVPK